MKLRPGVKCLGGNQLSFQREKACLLFLDAVLLVQILYVGKCHWLTTSNVNVHGGASYIDTICICDSGRPTTDVTTSVCSFYKCLGERVRFDIMNVSPQTNAHDCGVYAIAYATELAYGADPITWKCHLAKSESQIERRHS